MADRAQPDFGEYYRQYRTRIASRLSGRKRVYLDTKYWIFMRDAHLGRTRSKEHIKLYDKMCAFVRQGKAICPVSDAAVYEALRQNDSETRRATAHVMDLFSEGIALEETSGRVRIEILHFLRSCTEESRNLHPLLEWVWTHVASVVGTLLPYSELFSEGLNNAIQIGYWEELSKLRLTDLLDTMTPAISPFPKQSADALAAELTRGKLDHPHNTPSFKALFLTEVEGALDADREEITGALQHIVGREEMQEARVDAEVAMMIEQFRTGAIATQMPFINTQAGLHALFRWNRDQQFKANDWLDYMHAASALPYFDFFFTERVLARVVSSPPLAYDSLYGTHVRSDPGDALELLESI